MFSTIKQTIFIFICAVIIAGVVNLVRPDGIEWIRRSKPVSESAPTADATVRRISMEAARVAFQSKSAVFVDARNPENYIEAHIPRAINIPPEQFDADAVPFMNRAPPDREVILYCDGPDDHLAETLGQSMLKVGYKKLALFLDGWQGWIENGLPTIAGEDKPS